MKTRPTVLLALALLAIGCHTARADSAPLTESVPHLTTTGHADAEVVPDEADLRIGVSIERTDSEAATKAVAEAATAVVADVKARGIDEKDIGTDFELAAQYDRLKDANGQFKTSKLRGYLATETITVRLHDTTKAGPMARALIDKGANAFRGITFRYSKAKEKRDQLAADAMRNALAEARIYTDAIGLKLGRVLQVGDNPSGGDAADLPSRRAPPVFVPPPISPVASVPIPTEPGVIRLYESVTVVWEIEGKAPAPPP